MSDVAISRLEAPALDADIQAFSVLLRDCVEAGASIGFLAPFTALQAEAFWRDIADSWGAGSGISGQHAMPGPVPFWGRSS